MQLWRGRTVACRRSCVKLTWNVMDSKERASTSMWSHSCRSVMVPVALGSGSGAAAPPPDAALEGASSDTATRIVSTSKGADEWEAAH